MKNAQNELRSIPKLPKWVFCNVNRLLETLNHTKPNKLRFNFAEDYSTDDNLDPKALFCRRGKREPLGTKLDK